MLTEAGRFLRRIVLPLALVALVTVGLGLLLADVVDATWPIEGEDAAARWFAARRAEGWNTVTDGVATTAGAAVTVAATALAAMVVRLTGRTWREPLFLIGSVAGAAVVCGVTDLFVERDRPDVATVDAVVDPTAGFPSAQAAVAFALWGALATVFAGRLRSRAARALVWGLCLVMPLAVGLSRVYRGLDHPSDVVGAYLVAAASIVILDRAVLSSRSVWGRPRAAATESGRPPRAAVVVNPIKLDDPEDHARVVRAMTDAGWAPPLWLETTVEDPGAGVAAKALAEGVDLVLACGGDGTIREVAGALAGTDVPLAVLPAGTGNLLARNLGLPTDLADALHVALHGLDRRIDLGGVEEDGPLPDGEPTSAVQRHFTAMAGIGLDAAMMADAPDSLKKKVGWPAYAVSGARHLRDARMRVTLRIDDGEPLKRRARMVLVGNVGSLQAGMQLLPGAAPDDGLLDVVVFAPYGVTGWAHAVVGVLGRRRHEKAVVAPRQRRWRPVEHFTATKVHIETDRPEPRELDGDPIGEGTRMVIRVHPGVLRVRVPVPVRGAEAADLAAAAGEPRAAAQVWRRLRDRWPLRRPGAGGGPEGGEGDGGAGATGPGGPGEGRGGGEGGGGRDGAGGATGDGAAPGAGGPGAGGDDTGGDSGSADHDGEPTVV